MMNSATILNHALALADRCRTEAIAMPEDQLALLPALPAPPNESWQYGFGAFNDTAKQLESFTPLAHFTGTQWQASATLPDPGLGYVLLHANGGHPDQPGRAVIRRWVAPKSGTLTISGKLQHGSENGDGVRARVISSRAAVSGNGLLGEWTSLNAPVESTVGATQVEAGDTIDFMVDCITNHTSDSFQWPVTIAFTSADGTAQSLSSAAQFRGPNEPHGLLVGQVIHAWQLAYSRKPEPEELVGAMAFMADQIGYLQAHREQLLADVSETRQALTDLCQALLTSNEFLYVK